ncbi:histone-lysine N-methyltransferase, H3 lysine-79 specific [Anthonomus grandis grandis]|uniref:histone-lysine N-methyltransferase, H3 lysine-79 specific n=1 Tax=Anthonomus grandis grandis TaxID=2921223 RepID=UPI0021656144|nr:histone-lysine N-methyltransferase, H3 lysine-79 specific [Anthonomus grandis grandis]
MELRLNSPVGGSPAHYRWPLSKKKGYDESKEIIDTIIWGCKDIPDLEVPLKRNILKNVDVSDFESMKALTKRYNKAINNVLSLEKGTQKFCDRLNQSASKELLHHIIQQTYSAAVTNAEELNKYQAFSPDVYGETSFELISQMIDQINLTKDDVFVDLGSGVGQVVLQIAATCMCKSSIGIERADVPARYATAMEEKFKFWMQWYGKRYGKFQLFKDDFFDDRHREIFSEATVIFVNNFAFGPSVDHMLKQRFAELKHGTRIVSSKSFCPLNFRITDRNLSDIGTIMNISEITPKTSSVSWTDKPVTYYLHQIDRTKLERYFVAKKNGTLHSFISEDPEKSCDSFETTDSSEFNMVITPPPKKRGRRTAKPRISASPVTIPFFKDVSESDDNKPLAQLAFTTNGMPNTAPTNNIIRPSKLAVKRSSSEDNYRNVPPKKRGRKRKFPSPEFESTTWVSKGNPTRKNGADDKLEGLQKNLKCLMDSFKIQYLQMVEEMSDPLYKIKVRKQLEGEIIKNMYLKLKIEEIDEEIETIIGNMRNYIVEPTAKY